MHQITFGLAVKLHHKFGSLELAQSCATSMVSSQHMMRSWRFRKSAAKYMSGNGSKVHEAIDLMRRVGPIFGWFDNF